MQGHCKSAHFETLLQNSHELVASKTYIRKILQLLRREFPEVIRDSKNRSEECSGWNGERANDDHHFWKGLCMLFMRFLAKEWKDV